MSDLFNFAAITLFGRECLEGSIIIGEYRTIIQRGDSLAPGISKSEALHEVTIAAISAAVFALVIMAAIATPLAILSSNFETSTAYIIEGISKIVAAISLLLLSLEFPKFLGVYESRKTNHTNNNTIDNSGGLTKRNIRFNVAWNIWREVAECGVFLLPLFLSGSNLKSIPLSAVVGSIVGLSCGYGIYVANRKLKNKTRLACFSVALLVVLSAGLFTGGCHRLEDEIRPTKQIWEIESEFWSVNRLPMTLLKPFGYNDSRTLLEIICYWSWLAFSAVLHYRKFKLSRVVNQARVADAVEEKETSQEINSIETFEGLESQPKTPDPEVPATSNV